MRISKVICSLFALVSFQLSSCMCLASTGPSVCGLKCEYKTNPLGVDVEKPRLSRKIASGEQAVKQSAYQIQAVEHVEYTETGKKPLWDGSYSPWLRAIPVRVPRSQKDDVQQ